MFVFHPKSGRATQGCGDLCESGFEEGHFGVQGPGTIRRQCLMVQVAGESGLTERGDGRERRPGNTFIHSFRHVCGCLLGTRPCTRQPACPDSEKCSQSGVETGLCREPWGFRKHVGLKAGTHEGRLPGGGVRMAVSMEEVQVGVCMGGA